MPGPYNTLFMPLRQFGIAQQLYIISIPQRQSGLTQRMASGGDAAHRTAMFHQQLSHSHMHLALCAQRILGSWY